MISMSKYEIAIYLQDYCDFIYNMNLHPTMKKKDVFFLTLRNKNSLEKYNDDYYRIMRLVYNWFLRMKMFSLEEDMLLNRDKYINNTHLEYDIAIESLGINKNRLIQLIRDAFNHNNSEEVERFKISKNARFIEIEYLNIKKNDGTTGPIVIKLNSEQIQEIYSDMNRKRQTAILLDIDIPKDIDIYSKNLYQELGKIRINYYYIKEKLSREIIEEINKIGDENKSLSDCNELFFEMARKYGECLEYRLTASQKDKLFELVEKFKATHEKKLKSTEVESLIDFYIRNNVSVIPGDKIDKCVYHSIFCMGLLLYNDTFLDTLNTIYSMSNNTNPFHKENKFGQDTYEKFKSLTRKQQLEMYMHFNFGESFIAYSFLTYVEFVIAHCCNDEYINIDNNQYSVKEIRNSLVHGRWHVFGQNIAFYDADPRNVNMLNTTLVGLIDLGHLVDWANDYLEENKYRLEIQKAKKK